MTTTDLTRARRDVAHKRPANAVTSRNEPAVIDGEVRSAPKRRPRHPAVQAIGFLTAFIGILLFLGYTAALLTA